MNNLAWSDFEKIDMRTGTIISAEDFVGAKKPAIILHIDFGPLGIKKSSAQITMRYTPSTLVGRKVIAVVNFPPKQIGPIMSECLVLGAIDGRGDVALLSSEESVPNGWRIS